MKMVLIVYDTGAEALVEEALDRAGAEGWTRITDVIGKGRTGIRMGDPVFPGTNNMMVAVMDEQTLLDLREELIGIPDEFLKQLPFRVFVSDCETLI